jgi:uncharacterized protein (DUF736 family)
MQSGAADHTTSLWRNRAEDRLRLDRLSRNVGGSTFFPWAPPIPREARKSLRLHPPLRSGPEDGCVVDRLRPSDRHRGRDGRGLAHCKENYHGFHRHFQEDRQGLRRRNRHAQRSGEGVRIVPETNRTNEDAPTHRVFVGRAEIGAAWAKRSEQGRDYLSLKLDDPSFNAPIYTNLFDDEDGETASLIWSRGRRKQNGD